jgi:hypothetical protein
MECSLSASENSAGGYSEDFSGQHTEEDQAISPAARRFGATFSSTTSISVRNSTSCVDISRRIRARCGLFFAISRVSAGKPRFL